MRLTIIAIGEKMPGWVNEGCQEYSKRLQNAFTIKLLEITPAKRTKNTDPARAIRDESAALLAAIPPHDKVIALDLRGEHWTTETLARKMSEWRMDGEPVSLLIGGPDGFDDSVLAKAHACWALSKLTLPHPLVRVVLYEQLYRAWSIINHHPYHR